MRAKKQEQEAIRNFSEDARSNEVKPKSKEDKKKEKARNPEQLKEEIKGNYEKLFGIKKAENSGDSLKSSCLSG